MLCVDRYTPSAALAAAAEYENDSYDDKPDIAVIKKVAQTVVHKNPPLMNSRFFKSFPLSLLSYEPTVFFVINKFGLLSQQAFQARRSGMLPPLSSLRA